MSADAHALAPFVGKLKLTSALSAHNQAAILALPHMRRVVRQGDVFIAEGRGASTCCFLVSGFACRQKLLADGSRQILNLYFRGDGVDLQSALLPWADHTVLALTDVDAAFVPVQAVRELMRDHPEVGEAMWRETLLDASIQREWTVNVGRRDGRARIAHFLCELHYRQQQVGLGDSGMIELPFSQEQIGDCTALTAVHVNRMLSSLRSDGVLQASRGTCSVTDWDQLRMIAGFDTAYLYPPLAA